jgi:hypothetical protein
MVSTNSTVDERKQIKLFLHNLLKSNFIIASGNDDFMNESLSQKPFNAIINKNLLRS